MDVSVKRWVGYGGLVFFVLVAVAVFITPSTPNTNATAAKVVASYHSHRGAYFASAYIIVVAIIVGLTYFWYLREYLAERPANRRLLTVAFAGAIVFAVSGAVGAGLNFALADGSNKSNLAGSSMQTLNLLSNDFQLPIAAAGAATFLIVTGVVVIRNGGLPRWLGWVAVIFGVISATGFVGPAGVGVWVLLTSITVIVAGRKAVGPSASSQTTPPSTIPADGLPTTDPA
jgi:hypothetical protein